MKEKQHLNYTEKMIQITADISSETTQARKQMDDILKTLKQNECQPRIQYLPKASFKNKAELKTFSDKQKLKIPHNQIETLHNK